MDEIRFFDRMIGYYDERMESLMSPFFEVALLMDEMPGINQRAVENIIAEIGVDMNQFPDEKHLSSWAGICPGNFESAGKRKGGKSYRGSKWLKTTLVEVAWAAAHTKNSYFKAQYHRLAARRGKKRALVAVGHAILMTVYHILKYG